MLASHSRKFYRNVKLCSFGKSDRVKLNNRAEWLYEDVRESPWLPMTLRGNEEKQAHEPRHDKTNKVIVRPANTQISLDIRPVWSESSLSAWRKLVSLATYSVHSEDSDQTWQMPRLIWVFDGRTLILLVLSCRGSNTQGWTTMKLCMCWLDLFTFIFYFQTLRFSTYKRKMKHIAVLSLLAFALISLPVVFYYIDGSSPIKQIEIISESLATYASPVGECCLKLWSFVVDCICMPFIWTTNILLYFTEVIQKLLICMAGYFPDFTNIGFVSPMTFVSNVTASISNVISSVLSWIVHRGDGDVKNLAGEVMMRFQDDQQCVVDGGQDMDVEHITYLSDTDSFRMAWSV